MAKPNKSGSGVIRGNKRDNVLDGTDQSDIIEGRGGNDTLFGGLGDDRIDGGSGVDVAVFSGVRDAYTITRIDAVTVEISGPDGTDIVTNVETFVFDDLTQSFAEVILPREPNLTAASISTGATTLVAGEALELGWTLASNGVIDAENSSTRLVIANAPSLDATVEVFGAQDTGLLATGTQASFTGSFDTTGLPPGTYYVAAIADAGGTLAESDEGDNVTEWIAITIEAQARNLSVSNFTAVETVVTPSQMGVLSWEITADGNVSSGTSVTTLMIAEAPDLAGAQVLDQIQTASLAPGESATQTAMFDGAYLAPGSYWVAAFADGTGTVSETDETDNLSGWVQITVEEPRFDFAVTDLTISPGSDFDLGSDFDYSTYDYDPANLPGARFDTSITLSNDSNFGSGDYELRSYISRDGEFSPDDIELYWGSDPFYPEPAYFGTLAQGEQITLDLSYFLPRDFESGSYQLITVLYPFDGISEDESNNIRVSESFDLIGGFSFGTQGNDSFLGTAGDDMIEGYGGDDLMVYSAGQDVFDAGTGFDRVDYSAVQGSVAITILQDAVMVDGIYYDITDYFVDIYAAGFDPYAPAPEPPEYQALRDVESFTSGEGDDGFFLLGTSAVEVFAGGGADQILGGLMGDILDAGAGNDQIAGMDGDDLIITGSGFDEIYVARTLDALGGTTGQGHDVISDFDPLSDVLLIEWDSFAFGEWDPLPTVTQTADGARVAYAADSSVLLLGVDAGLIDASNLIGIDPAFASADAYL